MGLEDVKTFSTKTITGDLGINEIVGGEYFRSKMLEWDVNTAEEKKISEVICRVTWIGNVSALRKRLGSGDDIDGVDVESRELLSRLFLQKRLF